MYPLCLLCVQNEEEAMGVNVNCLTNGSSEIRSQEGRAMERDVLKSLAFTAAQFVKEELGR